MIDCDVVIIDSGANIDKNDGVAGVCITKSNCGFEVSKDFSDSIGHGTIIYSIVSKDIDCKKIFILKLGDNQAEFTTTYLFAALKFVKKNINCKIINISLGVKTDDNLDQLYELCLELKQKGIIMVSAFDNDGSNSFPAAFDCVIGVDTKKNISNVAEFDYVENSALNVLAKGTIQRIKINDGNVLLVGGSSIACAHITSILLRNIEYMSDHETALLYLKSKAKYIYPSNEKEINSDNNLPFPIANAIIFPFSKEAHAFVRFSDMTPFYIKDYYDVRYSGKIGRKITSYFSEYKEEKHIKDIDKIDFTGVDTIILGHLDEINMLLKRDYRLELINQAIKMKLNIYSFDPLDRYVDLLESSGVKYFYPKITKNNVPQNTFGKLYKISKPVVGIFGTSSQQGKFSLQITLKRELEIKDYSVGTVGTEPHSLLFGFDVIFPMGYNSTVSLQNSDIVLYLNHEINKLCMKKREIIIVASQAQTVPFRYNNLMEFPTMQYHFALGTTPDAIILCINYHDEISYIRNTVYSLSGLTDANVIALVMYPITFSNNWNGIYGESKHVITDDEFLRKKGMLQNEFNIPVFLLGEKQDMESLCQVIIDYF